MSNPRQDSMDYQNLKEFRILTKIIDQVLLVSPHMPMTRLRMFLEIAAHPNSKLREIAEGIDVTQSSASRHLGGLTHEGPSSAGVVDVQTRNGRDYEIDINQKGRLFLRNLLSTLKEMEEPERTYSPKILEAS